MQVPLLRRPLFRGRRRRADCCVVNGVGSIVAGFIFEWSIVTRSIIVRSIAAGSTVAESIVRGLL